MRTTVTGMLLLLSTQIIGCNTGFRGLTLEPVDAASLGVPMKLLNYDCKIDKAYNISAGTNLSWQATKTSGEVVTGTQSIQGTIVGEPSGPLNPQMLIDFFPQSLNTGVELRNTRIKDIVFNIDLGYKLQFTATTFTHVSGPTAWPKNGETAVYTVAGNLSVSNKSTPLTFNVQVMGTAAGLQVKPEAPLMIDVRTTLGLSTEISELLALVPGVDMQNQVKFDFSLPMQSGC